MSCPASVMLLICVYGGYFPLTYGNPVIQPSPIATVIEGANATFNCTYQHQENKLFILSVYKDSLNTDDVYVRIVDGCFILDYVSNVSCYDTQNTMTITLLLTDRNYYHGQVWFCGVTGQNAPLNTTLYIKIPVKAVNVIPATNDAVHVTEPVPFEFRCQSRGRPTPVIEWYKQKGAASELPIVTGVRNSTSLDAPEIESILNLVPTKEDNGYRVYCKAYNNVSDVFVISTNKPILNVLYKPNGPPAIINHINGSEVAVIESVLQRSTCIIAGGNPLASLAWDCHGGTVQQSKTSDTVSSTIIWSAQRGSNGQCKCRSQHIAANETVGFNVNILYPPDTPDIRYLLDSGIDVIVQDIDVIQGQNVSFKCHSDGNPAPTYSWSPGQIRNATLDVMFVKKNLTAVNCTATNEMNPTDANQHNGTNSSSVDVTILYPPSTPILTFFGPETGFMIPYTINTDTVDVISGDTFYIGCFAEGNPVSTYNWTKQQHVITTGSNLSIADIKPENSQQYNCTAYNVMKPTYGVGVPSSSSSQVKFNVMYGPSIPILYFELENTWTLIPTSTVILVIENTTFTIQCNGSTGNPSDVIYSWHEQMGNNLTITSIKPDNARLYTCNVTNEMKRTFGATEIRHNSKTIDIDVLYPPSVHILTDKQKEEGHSLKVTCNITKGNPEQTTFRWSHDQSYISSTAVLEIQNVTRNHTGVYTCSAYNTLQPTFGRVENGSDSKNFFLDVFYKTSIEQFYAAKDEQMSSNVTMNETDRINIYCSVNSNPNSNIFISRNEYQISMETNVTHISHSVETAACDDAGVYTCTAYNSHITDKRNASNSLHINVLCFPRASKPINNITTAAQNETVHVNVTLVAYPVPRNEDYVWRKHLPNNTWVEVQTTDRINISYGYLQTVMIINNIKLRDYGNYSLTVSNNVGKEFHQVFKLIPQEPPGTPMDFNVNVQNKDVRISWLPGFNGGFEQAFVIQLKTDKLPWYNISFDLRYNNSNQQSYTTLEGLNFDTLYNVRMFAYTILGRSRYVPDPPFVMTLNSNRISPTSPLTNTAAIIGGSIGVILVVIVIIIVIVLYVRRKTISKTDVCRLCQKKTRKADHVYYNTAHINNDDTEDSFRTDRRTSPIIIETSSLTDGTNTYEHIMIVTSQEEQAYSELKHYGTDDVDHGVQTDPSKIYINLRINGMHA